jgi:hypothetical protein
MPNTVPAADTGLPNLNRRSALAKLGLGLAASTSLAATAIAAPDTVSPELLRLIEIHRKAARTYGEALDRFNSAEKVYFAARPERPALHCPYGPALSFSLDAEDTKAEFLSDFAYCAAVTERDIARLPSREKELRAVAEALKKDGLAIIDAFYAQKEAARRSSGLADAEIDCARAGDGEDETFLALLSYPCRNPVENRLKAAAIEAREGELFEEHVEALLRSLTGEA